MNFKTLLFFFSICLLQALLVKSQNIIKIDDNYIAVNNTIMHKDSLNFTPYDIEDSLHQQYFTNTFSFLIKEDVYYKFKVIRIDYLSNGFGVLMSTKINGRYVTAYVVTANSDKIQKTKKIQRRNYYYMKLTRYVKKPIGRFIENPPIYDVLLQNTIVPVLSTGSFTHIFISENMIGLNYIDSSKAKEVEKQKLVAKEEIKEFVINFIQKIVVDRDTALLLNMTDTVLLKNSLLNVSWFVGPNMLHTSFKRPPKDLPKYFEIKKNKCNFIEIFWGVIDAGSFNRNYKKHFSIGNIKIDILFYHNGIYNVRAFWKYDDVRYKDGMVYIALKRENNKMKIIGMTKIQ